jgi:hypothetical protein
MATVHGARLAIFWETLVAEHGPNLPAPALQRIARSRLPADDCA